MRSAKAVGSVTRAGVARELGRRRTVDGLGQRRTLVKPTARRPDIPEAVVDAAPDAGAVGHRPALDPDR